MKKVFRINLILILFLIIGSLNLKATNNFFVSSLYANENKVSRPIKNQRKPIRKNINKKKPKKPYKKISYSFFKGNPQYKRQIKSICVEMQKDGRAEKFAEIVATKTEKDPYCIACKEMFEDFKDECGKKVKKEKKLNLKNAEDKKIKPKKTIAVIPQREMSLALIDLVDVFFTQLSQDEKLNKEATKAVIVLLYLLKNYEPMTQGEREYFDMLYDYIKQPFKELIKQAPNNKKLHEKEEKQLLHNLFGK